MRLTLSRSSGLLVTVAAAVAISLPPVAVDAQLPDVSGTTSTITGILSGTTTVLADTGTLAAGTSDALQASQLAGGVPSLLTADVLHAVTIGYPDQIDSEASLAALSLSVAGVNIGADAVMARVFGVLGTAGHGISNITNLSINGVPIPVTGDANQAIGIPGGVLIINEQRVSGDGTTVVNALHLIVYGIADVVVASATAGLSGGDAKAVQATTF